ncbi:hypothetical protein QP794_27105 [Paenibacillus sp. UMB7766-LJ446]|uniref:hypothetical protein n=1 Tax=Paenibacillus sp. UMB7766-LJ446 TaxID=3046313 RepID=UPI00254AF9A8|nr:hypothetical protein [Paenibacillus sp. UMB7766-LJ446]MDK8193757.1 hypothetical protein [Paenibacillus sp. UMB7766-LJ446]
MDYQGFFWDMFLWTQSVNDAARQFGMQNPDFWKWVADSAGAICAKYDDNRLAVKQMVMMIEWLEEVYEKQRQAG